MSVISTSPDASVGRIADAVDVHVGRAIRARRRAMGLSQDDLAKACGISFQQVQKYENGSNRVSCSMLVRIAATLKARAGDFFPDPAHQADGDPLELLYIMGGDRHGRAIARDFANLDTPKREALAKVASALLPDAPEQRLSHVA